MKRLIVWSGGYDSTALLLQYGFWDDREFDTCYCVLPNNESQQERELKAREKILTTLKEKYPNNKFGTDYVFEYVCAITNTSNDGVKIAQPYIWATTLAWNINLKLYDEVYMGYVKNDCFWHIKPYFEKTVKNGIKLLQLKSPKFKFKYPYEWYEKKHIHEQVYSEDNLGKLIYDIEICEEDVKCGITKKCSSCQRHIEEFGFMVNSGINYRNM